NVCKVLATFVESEDVRGWQQGSRFYGEGRVCWSSSEVATSGSASGSATMALNKTDLSETREVTGGLRKNKQRTKGQDFQLVQKKRAEISRMAWNRCPK